MLEIISIITLVFLVLIYVLCKAASTDDAIRERMSRSYEDADYFMVDNKPKWLDRDKEDGDDSI